MMIYLSIIISQSISSKSRSAFWLSVIKLDLTGLGVCRGPQNFPFFLATEECWGGGWWGCLVERSWKMWKSLEFSPRKRKRKVTAEKMVEEKGQLPCPLSFMQVPHGSWHSWLKSIRIHRFDLFQDPNTSFQRWMCLNHAFCNPTKNGLISAIWMGNMMNKSWWPAAPGNVERTSQWSFLPKRSRSLGTVLIATLAAGPNGA